MPTNGDKQFEEERVSNQLLHMIIDLVMLCFTEEILKRGGQINDYKKTKFYKDLLPHVFAKYETTVMLSFDHMYPETGLLRSTLEDALAFMDERLKTLPKDLKSASKTDPSNT
jgi:hypothetical protein